MAAALSGQVVPVKIRPDQYCGKIKDMGRGMTAKVTWLKDMLEYAKIEKHKTYDMNEKIKVMCRPLNNLVLENTMSGHKGVVQSHTDDTNNGMKSNYFIQPSKEEVVESSQVVKLKEEAAQNRSEEDEISKQTDDVNRNIVNADYCRSTKECIIPVKIRPDEYCSKIRERIGRMAQVTRVEEMIVFIKTEKDENHNLNVDTDLPEVSCRPPNHPVLGNDPDIVTGSGNTEYLQQSRGQEEECGQVEEYHDVRNKCSEENENCEGEQNILWESCVFNQLSNDHETGSYQDEVNKDSTGNSNDSTEGSRESKLIERSKVRIIPVKIRPDEYCSKIREIGRNGRKARVIRMEKAIEYIKIENDKSFVLHDTIESSMIPLSQNKEILASKESSTLTGPNELNDWVESDVFLSQNEKEELEGSVVDVEEDMTIDYNRDLETTSSASLNERLIDNFRGGSEAHICIHCNLTFPTRNLLGTHLKKHSEYRPFKCPICERGFKTLVSVQNHVNTHTGSKPYKCEFCEASFASSGQQTRHVRYIHTHEKPHKCKSCDYRSVEASKLKRHMRNHTGERPYPCPNCTYASPDTFSLKRHLRIHSGEKPYICDICGAKFSQSNSLKVHRNIHSEDKPAHKCELCPATLSTKSSLRHHVQKFHFSEQRKLCKRCGESFSDKHTLRAHEKIHKGEKCFKCGQCSFRSDSQVQLRSHMVIHCDEKLFPCDKCDQSFRWKHALKRHQNLQHNPFYVLPSPKKKSYQCPECGKCFIRKGSMQKHVALHDLQNTASLEKIERQRIMQGIADQRSEVVDNNTFEEHHPDAEASHVGTIHHVVLDVLPLPDDGEHGGVQIAEWSGDDDQEMVPPSQDIVQIVKSGDLQQQEEDIMIRKRLDLATCYGFCEDEDDDHY